MRYGLGNVPNGGGQPDVVNQITQMRLPNGQEVAFVDWSDMPLYSSVDILSGATDTTIDLFTYVEGQMVSATSNAIARRAATKRDTNLATPGAMASTEEMLVYSIRPEIFEYSLDVESDPNSAYAGVAGQPLPQPQRIKALQRQLLLALEVSQKVMHRAGLGYYNSGLGVFTSSLGDSASAPFAPVGSQGIPSQQAVRSLVLPIHIGGQEKYRVTLENETGEPLLNGLTLGTAGEEPTPPENDENIMHTIRVYFDGLYKRPVA